MTYTIKKKYLCGETIEIANGFTFSEALRFVREVAGVCGLGSAADNFKMVREKWKQC